MADNNSVITQLYNSVKPEFRDKLFYGDESSAQATLVQICQNVFGNTDDNCLRFCHSIYIDAWIRTHGSLADPSTRMPNYIKQALRNKYSKVQPELIEKATDEALKVIFGHEGELAYQIMSASFVNEQISQHAKINAAIEDAYLNDKEYGLVPSKPIFVAGMNGYRAYLGNLHTTDGLSLAFNRRGSIQVNGISGAVDVFDMFLPNNTLYGTLYVCIYSTRNTKDVPVGYTYGNQQAQSPVKQSNDIICPKCKEHLPSGAGFCGKCGTKLLASPESSSAIPVDKNIQDQRKAAYNPTIKKESNIEHVAPQYTPTGSGNTSPVSNDGRKAVIQQPTQYNKKRKNSVVAVKSAQKFPLKMVIIVSTVLLICTAGIIIALILNNNSDSRQNIAADTTGFLSNAQKYLLEMNYEQAVLEFDKVLEIDPMNVDAYLGKAEALIAMGKTDEAITLLEKAYSKTGSPQIFDKLQDLRQPASSSSTISTSNPVVTEPIVIEPSRPSKYNNTTIAQGIYGEYAITDDGKLMIKLHSERYNYTLSGADVETAYKNISLRDDIIDVTAGWNGCYVLTEGGQVLSVGGRGGPQEIIESWENVVKISISDHNLGALLSNGSVVTARDNIGKDWSGLVDFAMGGSHIVGLKADGTVVADGDNDFGQCDVSSWSDIVAVYAGPNSSVGIKSDGTVVYAGENSEGQGEISSWTNIKSIALTNDFTVGLRRDGTVLVVGTSTYIKDDYRSIKKFNLSPSLWKNIVAVDVFSDKIIGLRSDGALISQIASNRYGRVGSTEHYDDDKYEEVFRNIKKP